MPAIITLCGRCNVAALRIACAVSMNMVIEESAMLSAAEPFISIERRRIFAIYFLSIFGSLLRASCKRVIHHAVKRELPNEDSLVNFVRQLKPALA